jgi:hypothetical protein
MGRAYLSDFANWDSLKERFNSFFNRGTEQIEQEFPSEEDPIQTDDVTASRPRGNINSNLN